MRSKTKITQFMTLLAGLGMLALSTRAFGENWWENSGLESFEKDLDRKEKTEAGFEEAPVYKSADDTATEVSVEEGAVEEPIEKPVVRKAKKRKVADAFEDDSDEQYERPKKLKKSKSKKKKKRRKSKNRQIASHWSDSSMEIEEDAAPQRHRRHLEEEEEEGAFSSPRMLRLGGGLGYTNMSVSENTGSITGQQQSQSQNVFYLGLFGHYRQGSFGGELDSYYGFGPSSDIQPSGVSGTTGTRSLSQFGIFLNALYLYPIPTGTMVLVPKVGLGYGLHSQNIKVESASGGMDMSRKAGGIFGLLGVEATITPTISLNIDFSKSLLMVSGSETNNLASTTNDFQETSFSRFRIGGNYRLNPRLLLGLQFIARALSFGNKSVLGAPSQSEVSDTQNQIFATVLYEF